MESNFIVVFVAIEHFQNAVQIARILINEKLAGCCSILQNVTSFFEWENKLDERIENLMVIKTRKELFDELSSRIKELHPDRVPEIIALPISEGLPDYLNWLSDVTKGV